jgi:hypothetical protein
MPRLARLDAPGVFHHVMIRGIERRKIFRSNKDREDFLNRLGKLFPVRGLPEKPISPIWTLGLIKVVGMNWLEAD